MKAFLMIGLLILASMLGSCVLPVQGTPPPQTLAPGAIYTQAVQTVQAQLTAAFFTPTPGEPTRTVTPPVPTMALVSPEVTQTISVTISSTVTLALPDIPPLTAEFTITPPPPSETPLIVASDPRLNLGPVDFSDPFDSAVNWALTVDDHIQMQVIDGAMILTAFNPGMYNGWGFSWPFLRDFYLEIHATTGETCAGRDRYGIMFRAPDANRGYLLGISCGGEYALWYWNGDREINIVNWTSSPEISKGPNQVNRLGIRAQGDRLGIFVNGALLQEILDSTNLEGYFGLFIGAGQTAGFQVKVDNLEYWELE